MVAGTAGSQGETMGTLGEKPLEVLGTIWDFQGYLDVDWEPKIPFPLKLFSTWCPSTIQ